LNPIFHRHRVYGAETHERRSTQFTPRWFEAAQTRRDRYTPTPTVVALGPAWPVFFTWEGSKEVNIISHSRSVQKKGSLNKVWFTFSWSRTQKHTHTHRRAHACVALVNHSTVILNEALSMFIAEDRRRINAGERATGVTLISPRTTRRCNRLS
jgi:hypothetical protein